MPRYEVVIEKRAEKQLRRLPDQVQRRIEQKILSLTDDPRPADCTKLAGYRDRWRTRVGDYRVIYRIHDKALQVMVIDAGHRRDIYR